MTQTIRSQLRTPVRHCAFLSSTPVCYLLSLTLNTRWHHTSITTKSYFLLTVCNFWAFFFFDAEIARQAAQMKLMRKLEKQALARAAKEARKQQGKIWPEACVQTRAPWSCLVFYTFDVQHFLDYIYIYDCIWFEQSVAFAALRVFPKPVLNLFTQLSKMKHFNDSPVGLAKLPARTSLLYHIVKCMLI